MNDGRGREEEEDGSGMRGGAKGCIAPKRGRGNSAGCSVYAQGRKTFRERRIGTKAKATFARLAVPPHFRFALNMRQENGASFLVFQSCTYTVCKIRDVFWSFLATIRNALHRIPRSRRQTRNDRVWYWFQQILSIFYRHLKTFCKKIKNKRLVMFTF